MKEQTTINKILEISQSLDSKKVAKILDKTIGYAKIVDIICKLAEIDKNYVFEPYKYTIKGNITDIQKRLRALRHILKLTQQELAEAIGLKKYAINNYENNRHYFPFKNTIKNYKGV